MSSSEFQPGGLPHSSDGTLNWAADTDPVGPDQLRREEDMSTAEFGDPNFGAAPAPAPALDGQLTPLTFPPQAPLEPLAVPVPPVEAPPVPMPVTDMRDVPLGTLIFREGLLTEEQLEEALQDGMQRGKRLGEVLLERGLVSENDLGRLLAGQKGLPFVQLDAAVVDPAAVGLLSLEKARLHTVLPIGFQNGLPVVAVADPTNDLVIENVRRALNCEPHFVVAGRDALQRQIDAAYGATAAPAPPPQQPAVEPPVAPIALSQPTPIAEQPVLQQPILQPEPVIQPEPVLAMEPGAEQFLEVQAPTVPEEIPAPPAISFTPVQPVEQPVVQAPAPAFDPPPVPSEPVVPAEPVVAEPPVVVEPAAETYAQLVPSEPVRPAEPVVAGPPVAFEPVAETYAPPVPSEPAGPAEPVVAGPPVAFEPVAETYAQPVPEPEASSEVHEDLVQTSSVVLRLADGEAIEIGVFHSAVDAKEHARAVVEEITAGSDWPFFDGRFLRPDRIVSVDVIEPEGRWLGSAARRAAW